MTDPRLSGVELEVRVIIQALSFQLEAWLEVTMALVGPI